MHECQSKNALPFNPVMCLSATQRFLNKLMRLAGTSCPDKGLGHDAALGLKIHTMELTVEVITSLTQPASLGVDDAAI